MLDFQSYGGKCEFLAVRLKKDILNDPLLDYLRLAVEERFRRKNPTEERQIYFESYVMQCYIGIMRFVRSDEERKSTLEEDEKLAATVSD
jgi:hypothetical protein